MTIRAKFEFAKDFFYPKSLADQDPNFDYTKFQAEPVELVSGDTILISQEIEADFIELTLAATNISLNTIEDMFLVTLSEAEQSAQWTDNGYVVEVELNDIFQRAIDFFVTFTSTNPHIKITKL